jgi:hypothetical protein
VSFITVPLFYYLMQHLVEKFWRRPEPVEGSTPASTSNPSC